MITSESSSFKYPPPHPQFLSFFSFQAILVMSRLILSMQSRLYMNQDLLQHTTRVHNRVSFGGMEISKYLKYILIFCLVSVLMLVLIPGDPKNAVLLGFSGLRLLMLAGFGLLLGVLGWGIYTLNHNPQLDERIWARVEMAASKPLTRDVILAMTSLVVLSCSVLILDLAITTNQFLEQILLRLLPILVIAPLTGILVLSLPPFVPERRKWLLIILLSFGFMLAGYGLINLLLGDLDRPYPAPGGMIHVSKWLSMLLGFGLFTWLTYLPRRGRRTWVLLGVFVTLMLLIQWVTYPGVYWRTGHLMAIFMPPAILAATLVTMGITRAWGRLNQGWRKRIGVLLQVSAVLLLLGLMIPYYHAANLHARTLNDSPRYTDQSNYLDFARQAHESNFTYLGEHNQTAGYPFLQALFYSEGMDEAAFFERGKQVNIILSLILLAFMFLVFARYLTLPVGTLLALIVAFGLYIFKAPYFQAEVLYYFLAFLGFTLMAKMIETPGWILALLTGISLGAAQHVKASILPALAVFAAVYLVKEMVTWIGAIQARKVNREWFKPALQRIAFLVIVLLSFWMVIYPYVRVTKERFGQYFYNVNTSVYIWYDDFIEAKEAEAIYNFTDQWPPDMPADQVPGLGNYLRSHSLDQVIDRIQFGIKAQVTNIVSQFSVTNYQLTMLVLLILVFAADFRNGARLISRYPYLFAFGILFFGFYLAAFTWYSPISPERRFTYGLFIPLMFSIFVSLKELVNQQLKTADEKALFDLKSLTHGAYLLVGLSLIINIWLVLTERMFFDRYGS